MNAQRAITVAACLCFAFTARAGEMKISSPAFQNGGSIAAKFSHQGGNSNPPLRIEGVPANAKSLAVIVDDPDAPSGLFTHWLVWNIDSKTTINWGTQCSEGRSGGDQRFRGIRLWRSATAHQGRIDILSRFLRWIELLICRAGAKRRELEKAMKGHVIAQGELMGRFSGEIISSGGHASACPKRAGCLCRRIKRAHMLVSPLMGGMIWKIAGRDIDLSQRGMIMGVLNVTPDSFSDGGKFFSSEAAIEQGEQMAREGRRSSMSAANRLGPERSRSRRTKNCVAYCR